MQMCRESINYTNAPQCYVTSTLPLLFNNEFEKDWLEEILLYCTVLPGRIQDNNKHKIRAEGTVLKCRGHQTTERLHRNFGVEDIECLYVRTYKHSMSLTPKLCVCMYVCIYVCVYVCVYVCMYV